MPKLFSMDDSTERKEEEKRDSGEVDLSGLEDFNFASNWAETGTVPRGREKQGAGFPRKARPPDRRRRLDRDPSPGRARDDGPEATSGHTPHGRKLSSPRPDDRRPSRRSHEGPRPERRPPPESPFDIQVVPEDNILAALTKRMRASLRTYELFELARLILEKPERFHLSVRFKDDAPDSRHTFHISVPDQCPFMDEARAVDHVLQNHVDRFFKAEEIEVERPKGTFQFVMRCPRTGAILGPPNFHRYQATLVNYHQEHFPDMPFEKFRAELDTVRDEDAVNEWIQGMTKVTRYTPILPDGADGEPCEGVDKAREYLLSHHKERAVRATRAIRVAGVDLANLADPMIREALEYHVSMQRRFPLDSANSLRRRLRRQNFYIYKRGSKGISYVCAVKRRFREADQVFSDSLQELIGFLDRNPMIPASELPEKFLGLPSPVEDSGVHEADPRMKRLMIDLRWLLSEGYVTEYSDGRLLVHPVQQPARPDSKTSPAGEKPPPPKPDLAGPPEPETDGPVERNPDGPTEPETGDAAERALAGDPEPPAGAGPQTEQSPQVNPETEPAGKPIVSDEAGDRPSAPPANEENGRALAEEPHADDEAASKIAAANDHTRTN